MSTAQQRELVSSASVVGLTLDQYLRMIEKGILPEGEPIELLDGFLVRKDRSKAGEDPMTVGVEHMWAVKNLDRVLAEAERHGCHIALQQPIALPPDGAPEPDGAIVHGSIDDYRARYPSAPDLACVIEVADSSVHHDRVTKKRVYAKGGIAQYVIINLVDRQVEVFDEPAASEERYARETVIKPGDTVRFATGAGRAIEVEVTRLLP
jgi:Uma2 family endonuclease